MLFITCTLIRLSILMADKWFLLSVTLCDISKEREGNIEIVCICVLGKIDT